LVEVLFSFFHFVQFNLNLIFVFLTTPIPTFLWLINPICSNAYRFSSFVGFRFKDTLRILNDFIYISVIVRIIIMIELVQLFLVWGLDELSSCVVSQHRWWVCATRCFLFSRWPHIVNRRVLSWLLLFLACIFGIWIKLIRIWLFPLHNLWFILLFMTRRGCTIDLVSRMRIPPKLNSLFCWWRIPTPFFNNIWTRFRFDKIFCLSFIWNHTIFGLSQPFSIVTVILQLYFTYFQQLIILV